MQEIIITLKTRRQLGAARIATNDYPVTLDEALLALPRSIWRRLARTEFGFRVSRDIIVIDGRAT